MTIEEARELLVSPLWTKVRDHFLATGVFALYDAGDLRRIEYLDEATRKSIGLWKEAAAHIVEWKKILDGAKVRELKAAYPGVYPAVLKYEPYFAKCKDEKARLRTVLRLCFPEVYAMIES